MYDAVCVCGVIHTLPPHAASANIVGANKSTGGVLDQVP
jgi:hypothetical protein